MRNEPHPAMRLSHDNDCANTSRAGKAGRIVRVFDRDAGQPPSSVQKSARHDRARAINTASDDTSHQSQGELSDEDLLKVVRAFGGEHGVIVDKKV